MVVSKSTIRKLKKGIKWQIQTIQQIRHSLSLIKNNQNAVTDDLDKSGHTPYLEKTDCFL